MAHHNVSVAVERVGDLLIKESTLLDRVRDQFQELLDELRLIQSFSQDVDQRREESAEIRSVAADMSEVARDVVNIAETFAFKVAASRRRRGGGISKIALRFVHDFTEGISAGKVRSKIDTIKARIEEIHTSIPSNIVRESDRIYNQHEEEEQRRRSFHRDPHNIELEVVGRDEDRQELVETLVGKEDCRVVSICGMGGVGKTTLAKLVYNHYIVRQHFDGLAWVSISQQWIERDILQEIILRLVPEYERKHLEYLSTEELARRLCEIQQQRKCLVVLDDIWSDCDILRTAFPDGKTGSKLMLTTRIKHLGFQIDPHAFIYELRFLTDDESWALLWRIAFLNRESSDPIDAEMEKKGREMLKKCGGLPLSIIVLGRLLATKHTFREWEMVHQSVMARASTTSGPVQQVLALSYNDLPIRLRPCFRYLGHFQENYIIDAEKLCLLWIAEGMVSTTDRKEGETMMDVAKRYLLELEQRSMVQLELVDGTLWGPETRRLGSCRLHVLLRDLCLSKCEEEDFLEVIDLRIDSEVKISSSSTGSSVRRVHRRAIYLGDLEDLSNYVPTEPETTQQLSTVIFSVRNSFPRLRISHTVESSLSDFKMVRVLDLGGLVFSKLDVVIGKLTYLRYLGLRYTVFHELPSTIANLANLQILDLWDDSTQYASALIPNILWKLKELRHLYLRNSVWSSEQKNKLRLDGLSELETLENFDSRVFKVENLFKLPNLRTLGATVSSILDVAKIIDFLESDTSNVLQYLALSIKCCDLYSADGLVLLRKVLSCPMLQELSLDGRTGMLPVYNNSFSPLLTKITLESCELKEDPMATLEKLPNLRILILKWNSYVGSEMVCSDMGFLKLRILQLRRMWKLETWKVDVGAIPMLSSLDITSCPNLKMIPDGLKFVTTLQELVIRWMPKAFTDRVRVLEDGQEGDDFYKVEHVPYINIIDSDRKEATVSKRLDAVEKASGMGKHSAPQGGVVIAEPTGSSSGAT